MNNLLWLFDPLKKQYGGKFFITEGVRGEVVERPLKTKRFKFEAMQVSRLIKNKTFDVVTSAKIKQRTEEFLTLANSIFQGHGRSLKIVQYGEMASIALMLEQDCDAFVVDERTTRLLIENPARLLKTLGKKFHTAITVNKEKLKEFTSIVKDIKVLRSIELVTIAYEMRLLDKYLPPLKKPREELLDAVLWGMKIDGCAVSKRDINKIKKVERH